MMKVFLLFTFFILTKQKVNGNNVFYWKWGFENGQIKVSGKLNDEKEIAIYAQAQATIDRFVLLYRTIEEKKHSEQLLYLNTVDTLSEQLLKPFITEIKKSSLIVLNLDSTLLFFPIEVLHADTSYLALFRPMVFQMNNSFINLDTDTIIITRGFILRDTSADIDNNCKSILSKYPKSKMKMISDLSKRDLKRKHQVDFFFISAHGTIDFSSSQSGILLNETNTIKKDFLKKNNPKLIFTDACFQGINMAYISTLADTKEVNYYIGSLLTVDLADAASHTIHRFFTYLNQTHNPIISLWRTKKKGFDNYSDNVQLLTTINKSLLFRIYKL